MKKIFLSLFVLLAFLFIGCVSNGVETSDNPIITEYDEIKDVTYIYHEDMEISLLYNLRDRLTGERENIRVYIANDKLFLSVNYQYKKWAFFDSVVFLANGSRLEIKLNNRTSDIITGSVLREQYDTILTNSEINDLYNMLCNDSVEVAFIGKYTTDKMDLSAKVSNAMRETIKVYNK